VPPSGLIRFELNFYMPIYPPLGTLRLTKDPTKAVVVLDRPSIGEAAKTPGDSDGLAGSSIQALGPLEGVDPIEVSSDLSP
jgi:hypothetical protein